MLCLHYVTSHPGQLNKELSNNDYNLHNYNIVGTGYEYGMLIARISGSVETFEEVHTLKFKEALPSEIKMQWLEAIYEEHKKIMDYGVWESTSSCKPS